MKRFTIRRSAHPMLRRLAAGAAVLLLHTWATAQPMHREDPYLAIADLNDLVFPESQFATVQGIVTHTGSPLFVQDSTGATAVDTSTLRQTLRIGDEVQVAGTVVRDLFGVRLTHATVDLLGPSVPQPPLAVTASMAASGRYQMRFIETEGALLKTVTEGNRRVWLLERGMQHFTAELPASSQAAEAPAFSPGSVLRVRGVCLMASGRDPMIVPFRVLMRSGEDLEQIAAPPFLTRTHMLAMFALVLLAAYAGHLFYLRLVHWRFHAILDERARVAHDLHDTLAQSFAGINFQLQALRKAAAPHMTALGPYLDLAIGMVSHSHEDARRAIAMLKPAEFEAGNLPDNLRLQGEQMTQRGGLHFDVTTTGESRPLPRDVEQLLLRIGHEAVTNAISHAQATEIAISLCYHPHEVELLVCDNGVGMPADEARSDDGTPLRGYGIAGMRTRARASGGSFRLHSQPGAGVTVHVRLPVRVRARRLSGQLWKRRLQTWWMRA